MSHSGIHNEDAATVLCKIGQGSMQRLIVGHTPDRTIETVRACDWDGGRHMSPPIRVRLSTLFASVFNRKP